GERRVVERRLRDAGDAHEVLATAGHREKARDRARERRHAPRRTDAVGAVAALTIERVLDARCIGARDARRREQDERRERASHDSVAWPITIATEQVTARLFVPKHHRRSLFFDV